MMLFYLGIIIFVCLGVAGVGVLYAVANRVDVPETLKQTIMDWSDKR
jgi:hypothetical protein